MLKRLLVTGAAGSIGRASRPRLAALTEVVRLSDLEVPEGARPRKEFVACDLANETAVRELVQSCDGIVHLGGFSTEDRLERLLSANIVGLYNLYEAARTHGHPRMLFASSNHVVRVDPQERRLDAMAPLRPDSLYGVSKCIAEVLARMYFDKLGQETVIVRIGSCFERPTAARMLSTWLSDDDLVDLIACVFRAPRLGCPVVWGPRPTMRAGGTTAWPGTWASGPNSMRRRSGPRSSAPEPHLRPATSKAVPSPQHRS